MNLRPVQYRHLPQGLQIAIARAQMEVAEKRLALLLAQGPSAQTAAQSDSTPTEGNGGVELGEAEDNMEAGEPEEATTREDKGTWDAMVVPQSTRAPDIAGEDSNAMPPVTAIDDEMMPALDNGPTEVPDNHPGGTDTDENDEDARSAAADDNDEVEGLVRDDDDEIDAVTVKTESEKAETTAAPTNEEDDDAMPIGPFIGRILRWAGVVWSDAETRPGVDFEAAADLATEMMGFEIASARDEQAPRRAPLDIKSAKQWASKQRMVSKIYPTVAEPNYTQLVAQTWRNIREQPYKDVTKMKGRYGLIGVIRAIYQANAIDPKKREDFRVVMLDAADALRAMRATIGAARDAQPGPAAAPMVSSSLLEVLTQRNAEQTAQATEAIDRMSKGDIIEIESEDEEPARGYKNGSSGGGKVRQFSAKRKPTSTPGPPPQSKKKRS
ncbi:unnamed protein product [Peniophora sp. CBMAI 1063]|nr:unnamed protein product [Peniophora sp. CBMAI 1063]